jgi:hypothetical protein
MNVYIDALSKTEGLAKFAAFLYATGDSSRMIAKRLGISHQQSLNLIRKHQLYLMHFGETYQDCFDLLDIRQSDSQSNDQGADNAEPR